MSAATARRAGGLSAFARRPASTAALPDRRRVLMHHGTPVGSFAVQPRGSDGPLAIAEVDAAADVVLAIEHRRADAQGLTAERRLRDVVRDALELLGTFEVLAVEARPRRAGRPAGRAAARDRRRVPASQRDRDGRRRGGHRRRRARRCP